MQSDQMTFFTHSEHCSMAASREPDSGIQIIEECSSPNSGTIKHGRAVLKLRWLLWKFLRMHDIGFEFQAIDFTHWAQQQPQYDQTIDMRATGGMFRQLVSSGIVEKLGYRNNAGNKATNYHGTPRQVYRTIVLDYSKLGWLESLAGIEQDGVWSDSTPPKRVAS